MAPKTQYSDRVIPTISLANYEDRIDEITSQLVDAAEKVGFFSLCDHGIPVPDIENMFSNSERFFSLPSEVKATVPWNPQNVGYEFKSQVRPSTGSADQKESYQMQFGENMKDLWIGDSDAPGFKQQSLEFMSQVQGVSEKLMRCFARGLGFDDNYFIDWHDVKQPNSQSTLRLLHYFETPKTNDGVEYHRAGAHADWGFLTLLFQKAGQSGLEICPGREVVTEFALGDTWTKVDFPSSGSIICNIGDLLMSWSDDRFKSTFHRVKAPCEEGDNFGERYSIAYFNQPVKSAMIQGPKKGTFSKKYPLVTGGEFTANAMKLYYAALKDKVEKASTVEVPAQQPQLQSVVSAAA